MGSSFSAKLFTGAGLEDKIRVRRRNMLRETLDNYAEALALAESGERQLAAGSFRKMEKGRKRILALGNGHKFSGHLAEYAIELAGRLNYSLVLLSVGSMEMKSLSQRLVFSHRSNFSRLASEEACPWILMAVNRGLEAVHVVRFGDTVHEVEAVCGELHRVEVILSLPRDAQRLEGRAPSAVFTVD